MKQSVKIQAELNQIKNAVKNLEELLQSLPTEPSPSPTITSGETIEIWTDGACEGNPGPGGWGAVIRQAGQRQEFSGNAPYTTNNIMEMTAVIEALQQTAPESTIHLKSDSKYVINGISQWIFNWKKRGWRKADGQTIENLELWQKLDHLAAERKVQWEWVKGHAHDVENQCCDSLARQAIKTLK